VDARHIAETAHDGAVTTEYVPTRAVADAEHVTDEVLDAVACGPALVLPMPDQPAAYIAG